MSYSAPVITSSGLTIPSYQDILADLMATYQSIYGQDVYLGSDSADYQWISAVALRLSDCMQALQFVYNNRGPQLAIGAALDSIVKVNGIRRKVASYSTCTVTLTGVAGTVINNGIVSDINGNKWDLPPVVTIGGGGTIDVVATCEVLGAISAFTGNINSISTPTAGWTSVTNSAAASPGLPVETDTQLRGRQSVSVALPSETMLYGTIAGIAQLAGVARYRVYENPTDSVDSNGLARHSIAAVVEGGVDNDIAQIIYNNRGIGCTTLGSTTVSITDPYSGVAMDIKFSRPIPVPIYVALSVHALAGYTSAIGVAIQTAVAAYLNSLQIGEEVTQSALYAAAMSVTDITNPTFSIRALALDITSNPTATSDIVIAYDHVASGDVANVSITLV